MKDYSALDYLLLVAGLIVLVLLLVLAAGIRVV